MPNGQWEARGPRGLDNPVSAAEARARMEREALEREQRNRARAMEALARRPELWPAWLLLHPEDRSLAPREVA